MIKKYQNQIIIVSILLLLVIAFILNKIQSVSAQTITPNYINEVREEPKSTYIYIDLKGEVNHPGVYKVNEHIRLFQLIHLAGGLTVNADESKINLSQILFDQNVIVVPPQNHNGDSEITDAFDDGKISLNHATKEALISLPNIGPATADRIIEYRMNNGPFTSLEDILKVSGIGEATFEAIKPFIKL
jgi:competence protein ComEA